MWEGHEADACVTVLGGETMGTRWNIRLVLPVGAAAGRIEALVVARLGEIVAQMSQWESESLLSRFNRSPAGSWTRLPPDFATVMATALRIAEESGGAFDPTLGQIVDLHGFGAVTAGVLDPAAVERVLADAGWRRLAWDAQAGRLRNPGGLALDLAGIAKGYAVDAVAKLLMGQGVRHSLVEIGGELVGRGVRPDGEPWWVDLEVPPGLMLPPLRIALHGLAVATSGDYRRGAHTLDPATGRPVRTGIVSLSVIHATAMEADAWASALTVLGVERAVTLADKLGLAACIVTSTNDGGQERLTKRLTAMIEG